MKDKNIVGILTVLFFLLYFLPFTLTKFVAVAFILFFAPGFFLLRCYKRISGEELLLLSIPLSFGISGIVALLLAALSLLTPQNMLILIGSIILIGFTFSTYEEIKLPKISKPDRLVSLIVTISLILMVIWIYYGITTPQYKEVDIGIVEWPKNATINDTLYFKIYVKNWDYDNATLSIVFKMNNETLETKTFSLSKEEEKSFYFVTIAQREGKNLASFDLFVNGEYYTNVHVYFYVNPE